MLVANRCEETIGNMTSLEELLFDESRPSKERFEQAMQIIHLKSTCTKCILKQQGGVCAFQKTCR